MDDLRVAEFPDLINETKSKQWKYKTPFPEMQ